MRFKVIGYTFLLFGLILFGFSSCKKEKNPSPIPEPPANQEELITTFKVIFTDSATGINKTYLFKDPDGTGGHSAYYGPDATSQTDSIINLSISNTYSCEIIILDESKIPTDTISNEVREEANDHMLFFNQDQITKVSANPLVIMLQNGCRLTYLDYDQSTAMLPLGLHTKWRTPASTSRTLLNITLKHQAGTKNGTFAPGESDISVNFILALN